MLIAAVSNFLGAASEVHATRLPDGIGVTANNLRLGGADLQPWNAASVVHSLPGLGAQQASIYRMGRDTTSDISYWLSSVNDVDYVRSLIASDTSERTYYTGETEPRVTDNVLGLTGTPYPSAFRTLGVPAPSTQMAAALGTAGSGPTETRVYLDTFLTDKGEESAPNSLPTSINVLGGSTVNLSSLAAVPGGSHGINRRNIYVSTGGEYQFVLQQLVALTTATDSGNRGAVLQSGGSTSHPAWLVPPTDLKGLIELWNGMVGGFSGKSYRVCEPFKPWAWPIEYEGIVPDTIVGTGKWAQNWLILTTARPRVASFTSPGSMGADRPVDMNQSCLAKRSIVSHPHGVTWASPDGMCYVGSARAAGILTEGIFTPAQWRALVPSSMICTVLEGWLYCSYDPGSGRKAFLLDPVNPRGVINLDQGALGTFYDPVSDRLYLLDTGNQIRKWDSGSALTVTFKTKTFRHPYETNPGVLQVVADSFPWTVKLWSDGVLKATVTAANGEPYRLPAGYLARNFQLEASGTGRLQGLVLAEETADLP